MRDAMNGKRFWSLTLMGLLPSPRRRGETTSELARKIQRRIQNIERRRLNKNHALAVDYVRLCEWDKFTRDIIPIVTERVMTRPGCRPLKDESLHRYVLRLSHPELNALRRMVDEEKRRRASLEASKQTHDSLPARSC